MPTQAGVQPLSGSCCWRERRLVGGAAGGVGPCREALTPPYTGEEALLEGWRWPPRTVVAEPEKDKHHASSPKECDHF